MTNSENPECPNCEEDLNVGSYQQWDAEGFEINCPKCGKRIAVRVEAASYEYTVKLAPTP